MKETLMSAGEDAGGEGAIKVWRVKWKSLSPQAKIVARMKSRIVYKQEDNRYQSRRTRTILVRARDYEACTLIEKKGGGNVPSRKNPIMRYIEMAFLRKIQIKHGN